MVNATTSRIFEETVSKIDIPESAYEKAAQRYKDLAAWLARLESKCARFSPHVYPQGSFRIGTVVRPINTADEYDLDLGCRLLTGISKATHTQKQLKNLVGDDLEAYRVARNIGDPREEKHRCWRLKYADTLQFHMDSVPSIPESTARRQLITESMVRSGIPEVLAKSITEWAGSITDTRLANYAVISNDWYVSNSEGYARWFESRMKLAGPLLERRAVEAKVGKVDDLPVYRWKSPLQRCVQLLKRHRDSMFQGNLESKPVSIILTTLSGRAYQGEPDIEPALDRILSTMGGLVARTSPRIPNPVYPAEDFADKWLDPARSHLSLEANFWRWLEQAKSDFALLGASRSAELLIERSQHALAVGFSREDASHVLTGETGQSLLREAATASGLSFPPKPLSPTKPAGFALV